MAVLTDGTGSATIGAKFSHLGRVVAEPEKKVSYRGAAATELHLDYAGGIPAGEYDIEVFFNGQSAGMRKVRSSRKLRRMSGPPPARCPSCGAAIDGRFCAACGEKRVTAHDYSITHFAEHVLESLTHFDFKSLRAVRTLVTRPGRLTRDYLDGRRRGYIGPIQLFVIVNVVFALVGPNSFRTPLSVQEHDRPFPALKQSLVARAIARERSSARSSAARSTTRPDCRARRGCLR